MINSFDLLFLLMKQPTKRLLGFSLIELLISLAILALLATLAVPMMELTNKRRHEQELRMALSEIRLAIDAYKTASDEGKITRKADETGYPPNLEALYVGVIDVSNLDKKKIFFLRRLPRDPFFPDANIDAANTWAKRSYDSDYDKPQEGKDVYDIYSMSPERALNRTAYKDW